LPNTGANPWPHAATEYSAGRKARGVNATVPFDLTAIRAPAHSRQLTLNQTGGGASTRPLLDLHRDDRGYLAEGCLSGLPIRTPAIPRAQAASTTTRTSGHTRFRGSLPNQIHATPFTKTRQSKPHEVRTIRAAATFRAVPRTTPTYPKTLSPHRAAPTTGPVRRSRQLGSTLGSSHAL